MPRTTLEFDSGYSTCANAELYKVAFIIDGEAKILSVLDDTPLSDLSSCLRQLADWVDSKRPTHAKPEPPAAPELELVDP